MIKRFSDNIIPMIDLESNKAKFEEFVKDSFSSLNSSEQKNDLLKRNGNASHGNLHGFYRIIISQNKSYNELFALFSSDSEILDYYGNIKYVLFRFIDNMILNNKKSGLDWLTFHDEIFVQVFADLKNELYDPNWEYVAFSNLTNFRSDQERFDFGVIKILPRSDDELKRLTLWEQSSLDFFWKQSDSVGHSSEYVIATTDKIKKEPNNLTLSNSYNTFNNIRDFITALRLFKDGSIGIDIVYDVRRSKFFEMHGMSMTKQFCEVFSSQDYILNANEVPAFQIFWNEISCFVKKDWKKFPHIRLALNRFNLCYDSRQYSDDKIVDSNIALEALFINKIRVKKKKFLSFCVSRLLFKSQTEQDVCCKKIYDYYDARNAIVHSLEQTPEIITAIKNVDELITYVRKCIVSFIRFANCDPPIFTDSFYRELKNKLANKTTREDLQNIAKI